MNLTESTDTDTTTKAETNCPSCGGSFRVHERMKTGDCELCQEETDAATDFSNEWEDELDSIHYSDLYHIRCIC